MAVCNIEKLRIGYGAKARIKEFATVIIRTKVNNHCNTHTLQTSGMSQGGGSSSSLVSRRSGSMASMSGGNDMVYLEVKSKAQHPLFKLRRQQ